MTTNAPPPPAVPADDEIPTIAGVRPLRRRLAAGEFLFRQGDRTVGMFFLESGRLRMQRVTPDGGTVSLHGVRAGETCAEASLFSSRYHCDMLAEADAEVWRYPKQELVARLRNNPEILWDFAGGLARGLQGMRQRYELKQIRSAPERVLQLLRLRCAGDGSYRRGGTLKDMAAELGMTHEALYRALAALERSGRLRRDADVLQLLTTGPRQS